MEDRIFNAAELQILLSVLRKACADVGPVDGRKRSKIANRILAMARDGERDFETLRSGATVGLTLDNPPSVPPENTPRRARRLFVAMSIALIALYVPVASAAQLVYVEWKDCGYCKSFNRQMAWAYASSAIGKKVPLRRVDILRRWPADLKQVKPPSYTPVFILVENGREVGRFDGYTSPQVFTRKLKELLQRRP